MSEYVCGLVFSEDRRRVVLIKKTRGPANVVGRWNGVGGRVEPDEMPVVAMAREFMEETGVATSFSLWRNFMTLTGRDWIVYFFSCFDNAAMAGARTAEEEIVSTHMLRCLPDALVSNLRWIIPMALESTVDTTYAVNEA